MVTLPQEIWPDAEAVARRAAQVLAQQARAAVAARGRFLLALSGGTTPWRMLRLLAEEDVPWARVQLFQVDERVAPDGDADRNLTHVAQSLLAHLPLQPAAVHAMPVGEPDLGLAAARYAAVLQAAAGVPPVMDLVHLGLGEDGHTASLVPEDPALDIVNSEVAATGPYQGRRRLTLTFPALNRARFILWVVTGAAKAGALTRLRLGDRAIPASGVRRDDSLLLADAAANDRAPAT